MSEGCCLTAPIHTKSTTHVECSDIEEGYPLPQSFSQTFLRVVGVFGVVFVFILIVVELQ
jgi:hypothetical protein